MPYFPLLAPTGDKTCVLQFSTPTVSLSLNRGHDLIRWRITLHAQKPSASIYRFKNIFI